MDQLNQEIFQYQEVHCLQNHENCIILLEQDYENPDYIISVSHDNVIIIWNITSMEKVYQSSKGCYSIISIALQYPRVAFGNNQDGKVQLFEINNQENPQIMKGSEQLPVSWQLKFRKHYLVSAANGNIIVIWNFINNQKLRAFKFLDSMKQIEFISNNLLITTQRAGYLVYHKNQKILSILPCQAYRFSQLLCFAITESDQIKIFYKMKKLIKKTKVFKMGSKIIVTFNSLIINSQMTLLSIPTLQETQLENYGKLYISKSHYLFAANNNKIGVIKLL